VCEGLEEYNSRVIKRAVNTKKAELALAAEKSPDKDFIKRLVYVVSSYLVFSKIKLVNDDNLLQVFPVKDYMSASLLLFFEMLLSPTTRRPITRLNLDHTRTFLFEFQIEMILLPVNFSFILWPGDYTKVEFYRKAYATVQLYLCGGDLERLPQAIKKEVMQVLTPGWFSLAFTCWENLSSNTSLASNSQHVDLKIIETERPWDEFSDRLVEAVGTDKQYESLKTITKVRELGLESTLSFPEKQEVAPSSNISSQNSSKRLEFEHLVTTSVTQIRVSIASTVEGGTEIITHQDRLGEFQYLVASSPGLQRSLRRPDRSQFNSSIDTDNFKTKWGEASKYMPEDMRIAIHDYQLSSQRQSPPIRVIQRSKRNPVPDVARKLEPSSDLALAIQEADRTFLLGWAATPSLVRDLDPPKYATVASEPSHKVSNFTPGIQKIQSSPQSQKQSETTHKQDSSLDANSQTSDNDSAVVRQIILGEFEHQEKKEAQASRRVMRRSTLY
jgi:hypothetical protein